MNKQFTEKATESEKTQSVASKYELKTWGTFYCSLTLAKTKKSDNSIKSCHDMSEMVLSCISLGNIILYTHFPDILTASSKIQDIIPRSQQFYFCVCI